MTLTSNTITPKSRAVLSPYSRYGVGWQRKIIWTVVTMVAGFCLFYGFFYALVAPFLFVFFMAPLAIMAVITIWALPDMQRAPTNLLPPLLFAFLTALILWPNYLAISLPGLPWITMIRLTTFPMAFILLICLSISLEFRTELTRILSATSPLWKAVLAFGCVQFLAIAFATYKTQSFQYTLVAQTSWTAIFFISAYVFSKPGRVKRFAVILWLMSIIVGCIGMMEVRHQQVLWGSHIPSFLKVGDEVVQRILAGAVRGATGQYRIQATFSTALGLSEYCALTLPFVLHFLMSKNKLWVRLAALASIPFLLIVIINTDARLGLLGFFLGVMVYFFLWGALKWTNSRQSLIGPATVLAYPGIFIMAVTATFVVGKIRNKVWGSGQYAASNAGRMAQVEAGWPKVFDHPIGHGPAMAGDALGYANAAGVVTVDSYILSVGLEVGIIGLLIYIAILSLPIFYSIKYSFTKPGREDENTFLLPVAVCLISFFAIKFVFANDDNHPLIYMVIGIAAALVYRARSVAEPDYAVSKTRRTTSFRRPAFSLRLR